MIGRTEDASLMMGTERAWPYPNFWGRSFWEGGLDEQTI